MVDGGQFLHSIASVSTNTHVQQWLSWPFVFQQLTIDLCVLPRGIYLYYRESRVPQMDIVSLPIMLSEWHSIFIAGK
jgi:hypothetical protein